MLDSFDLRTNGLNGMSAAFETIPAKKATQAGNELAEQMQRLAASDVIWEDLFKDPTKEELANLSITGVNVPSSIFLANPDIATTASMKSVWQRIHGAATGGSTCSPRGTGIVSTKVLPSGKELSTSERNTIQTTQDLGFAVTVKNQGCAQEVGLKVRLSIQQSTSPIKKDATIDLLDPGRRGDRGVQRPRPAAARPGDVADRRSRAGARGAEHHQQHPELRRAVRGRLSVAAIAFSTDSCSSGESATFGCPRSSSFT